MDSEGNNAATENVSAVIIQTFGVDSQFTGLRDYFFVPSSWWSGLWESIVLGINRRLSRAASFSDSPFRISWSPLSIGQSDYSAATGMPGDLTSSGDEGAKVMPHLLDTLLDMTIFGNNRTADLLMNIEMSDRFQTWMLTIVAACLVGLSGIVPLAIIPLDMGGSLKQNRGNSKTLRLLLSFAVGGLLGDVFLHLLPEAWDHAIKSGSDIRSQQLWLGLWALFGLFLFTFCEMIFTASKSMESSESSSATKENSQLSKNLVNSIQNINSLLNKNGANSHHHKKNGLLDSDFYSHILTSKVDTQLYISKKARNNKNNRNSLTKLRCNGDLHESAFQDDVTKNNALNCDIKRNNCMDTSSLKTSVKHIQVAGYLNLLANSIDNFTHGLAVAGSFLVGTKMGLLTTLAILIHEVPHEFGDYAILLRSGFTRWDAAKAQLSTASIGILGAIATLCAESTEVIGAKTAWILPFTAGGFLNIALVNVLPDLLKEDDPWESVKQVLCIFGGIGTMLLVNIITE